MFLYYKLKNYQKENIYPFHMPGHKRNTKIMPVINPYEIDITEIDGFDYLHNAKGVIKKSMERVQIKFRSTHSFYLVNGSTSGILAGILGSTNKGDTILVARNCHQSVYNAIVLNQLVPVYLYPQMDKNFEAACGYNAEYIETMLIKHPDIKLIVLVSPTYEGLVSEIDKIVVAAHKRNVPVLVDEAHGAHFCFSNAFPKSAVEQGADIVIHSVHKTLPAFTQTALMHVNSNLISLEKVEYYSSVFQSSSPSYVLMAGIDQCMNILDQQGNQLFQILVNRLNKFYKKSEELKHLRVMGKAENRDFSKIIISCRETEMTGIELYDILLNKYKLQMEMVSKDYVLGIATICDTEKGFERLEKALFELDQQCFHRKNRTLLCQTTEWDVSSIKMNMPPYRASCCDKEEIYLIDSIGKTASEFVFVYPPGIPLIVPGEEISEAVVNQIINLQHEGLELKGIGDGNKIKICCKNSSEE
ncbi:aminotransferase class I/II-fold pyridoxal phosphate-dependent enzyme [Anaeromicropila populeti]|uniref:Arginine/lysine/ornithine decarboxylase n=1 Tax=Anaeromicropila populeti TaxID=37658 RepID=A0A1I6LLS2_9FIRM|nr:aminotransferase class I/II-fold pyridoxal phosphate-dependent enzyme [Anaeromicropila populeti]SFS04507.1 Arginine/lysine/ornithine decarboxylase [Anaeromicropila populeti]